LLVLFCVGILNTSAQITNIIPSVRLTGWEVGSTVGPLGGVPSRSVYTTLSVASGSNITTVLQDTINACPSNQVVVIPEGTFTVSSSIYLPAWITVRGAGMSSTHLNMEGAFVSTADQSIFTIYQEQVIAGGLAKGSTNLHITNTTTFAAGKIAYIGQFSSTSQTDTNLIVGVGGTNNQDGYIYRVQARVMAVGTTNITIWPPLHGDMSARHARIKASISTPRHGVGLEDLDIVLTNSTIGVNFGQMRDGWVRRVRVRNSLNYSISFADCVGMEMSGCYLDDLNHGGSNGAGFLMNTTSASLIENNVVLNSVPGMEINAGSCGNVIAYNFLMNTNGYMEIDSNHGPHNAYNLYEGNVLNHFLSDGYFGSESHGTVFRNWITGVEPALRNLGWVLALKRFTRNYSIVGNYLGIGLTYTQSYSGLSFGGPNMGNSVDNGSDAPPWADWGVWPGQEGFQEEDTNVLATVVKALNYYTYTTNIPPDEVNTNTIPASLYRTVMPSFFAGTVTNWPPVTTNYITQATSSITNTILIPAQYAYFNSATWPTNGGGGDTPATPRRKFKGIRIKQQ
jgi:hypothetical protein